MRIEFQDVLNDWYGSTLQRTEIIKESKDEILLFVAYRDAQKVLNFDITRLFMVGDKAQINVDESVDNGLDMDKVFKLIQAVVRVI